VSPWPELAFYLPILRVVFRSSWLASRGRYGADQWVEASLNIIEAMEGVGMRLSLEGMGVLKEFSGPAVFVANHMSTLETFVLPSVIQPIKPVTFVVKDSLVRYPIFGPIMRSRDPVVVGRKNPREDLVAVMGGGEQRLRRGTSIIVFPQGTRFASVDAAQFNTLGAKLAARAGVPLIPIALDTIAWGTGRRLKDFGKVDPEHPVRIRFGAPLLPSRKGAEAHETAVRFILETLASWASAPGCGGGCDSS
jgi:1-acyl-sn-glycerol-3-phosphate acyltransferase